MEMLKNLVKISWVPTRVIQINEPGITHESVRLLVETERLAKLKYREEVPEMRFDDYDGETFKVSG